MKILKPPFVSCVLLTGALFTPQLVDAKENKKKKIAPLSEAFLLFLAEMEEVDGELVHAIDLSSKQVQKKQISETSNVKTIKTEKGKKDDK